MLSLSLCVLWALRATNVELDCHQGQERGAYEYVFMVSFVLKSTIDTRHLFTHEK